MLPLLKKNREQTSVSRAIFWHPDFRNTAQLPDAKVIRTAFFLNALLGIIVVLLLLAVVFQELSLAGLRDQIRQLDENIARDSRPSRDALLLFGEYNVEEKKIEELETFGKKRGDLFSRFFYNIGKTIPAKISISSIEYSNLGVNFRGFVIGTPEQATTLVSSYEKQLQGVEVVGKLFDKVTLANLSRVSEGSDKMTFEMVLRSSAAKNVTKEP